MTCRNPQWVSSRDGIRIQPTHYSLANVNKPKNITCLNKLKYFIQGSKGITLEEKEKNEDLLSIQGLKRDAQILDVISPTGLQKLLLLQVIHFSSKRQITSNRFWRKNQNTLPSPTLSNSNLNNFWSIIFTALTFLNSVRYLRTCILLKIYSTVAQKFIEKKESKSSDFSRHRQEAFIPLLLSH